VLRFILIILFAPLVSGFITRLKNNLRLRRGPSIFQPYYNLAKYFRKDEVVSQETSWIFRITPYLVFTATASAVFFTTSPGSLITLIFLFSFARFFLVLAGLDAASSFGGMGSSREMFISSFIEPVLFLSVAALWLSTNSMIASALAATALFLAALAETSRIPVDNQETHLELTMVHEAMLLEYSGRSLAILELAAQVKQLIFLMIIAGLIFNNLALLPVIAVLVALVELSLAKMRLFRVVDYIAFAGVLAVFSVVMSIVGAII